MSYKISRKEFLLSASALAGAALLGTGCSTIRNNPIANIFLFGGQFYSGLLESMVIVKNRSSGIDLEESMMGRSARSATGAYHDFYSVSAVSNPSIEFAQVECKSEEEREALRKGFSCSDITDRNDDKVYQFDEFGRADEFKRYTPINIVHGIPEGIKGIRFAIALDKNLAVAYQNAFLPKIENPNAAIINFEAIAYGDYTSILLSGKKELSRADFKVSGPTPKKEEK
ncbi:hypothetical protein J4463_03865 [Candidatus Pacearchaeota archaeon]|nr:hypothetical protein [Candidatus Pacearchaeota archaeon]